MRIFGFILILHLTAPALWGQSLYLVPHFNYNLAFCRVNENSLGTPSFRSWIVEIGHFGLFAEYQSREKWRIGSGITTGAVGLGFQFDYYGGWKAQGTSDNYLKVPILFMYNWKDIRLFRLHNYREERWLRRPTAKDENVFYALLFKVQPIVGMSFNSYTRDLEGRWSDYEAGWFNIERPIEQLRSTNFSAIIGFRLQFYSFGKDRLALTALYHQGLQDVIEMNARYTINGNGPYFSTLRNRGSGLSLTLSYPIRVFTFDKEERQLRKQNR